MKKYFAIIKVLNSLTSEVFIAGALTSYDTKLDALVSLEKMLSIWNGSSIFKVLDKKVVMKKFDF